MKKLFAMAIILTASISANAIACDSSSAPIEKAKCRLQTVIAEGSNTEISNEIQMFSSAGLKPSGEVSASFVGGSCAQPGDCNWNYIVSTDYYNLTTFKTVTVLIGTSLNGNATLKRVLSQSELN